MHPNVIETIECDHNFGFALKVKNPFFKLYNLNIDPKLVVPILESVDKKSTNHFDGTILLVEELGRYFHDFLELFPKLASLKANNKKFKLILNSQQEIPNKDKVFMNMLRNNDYNDVNMGGRYNFSYLLDFLKKYDIEFECHNFESKSEISADYAYIFYSKKELGGYYLKDHEVGSIVANKELDFMENKEYTQTYSLFPGIDDPGINVLRNFFPKHSIVKNKKTFIGRRPDVWIDRGLEGYDIVQEYFKNIGYEIVDLEDLNLFEQIKTIQESEFIVSLVGSSLINSLLCGPGNHVLILNALPYNSQIVFLRCLDEANVDVKNIYCGRNGNDIIKYIENSKSSFLKLFLN
jgi:hypothetical protein